MSKLPKYTWAIRDIVFSKAFFFETYDEMMVFILKDPDAKKWLKNNLSEEDKKALILT